MITTWKTAGAKFIARGVPFAVKEDGEAVRTIVIEWESMEAAENGYNSPDYQNALKALDNGANRAFMYLEADWGKLYFRHNWEKFNILSIIIHIV